MNEMEQILVSLIRRTEKTILTPEGLAKEFAPKLMEAARKEIVSKIDVDSMVEDFSANYVLNPTLVEIDAYRMAIEDTLKAIKGESV